MDFQHRGPEGPDRVIASLTRNLEAAGRDRAAERRDVAARRRDEEAEAGAPLRRDERRLAARDREAARRDRRAAAADRRAAHRELADEGIDSLTGVMRRGVGLAAIRRELARSGRDGTSLVLAFVDIVGLKLVNDSGGHAAGDLVIREVASLLRNDLRSYDIVTRIGGDEFVCVLPGETLANARTRYAQISSDLVAGDVGAAITVGLTAYQDGDTVEALVDRADVAMIATRR